MSAEVIGRWCLDRQVHKPELFVHCDLSPDTDVAVDRPRLVFPRLVPVVARPRNGVELPEPLACLDVERAHQTLGVVVRGDGGALAHRGPDDHGVFHHDRCRVNADLTGLQIDRLGPPFHDAGLQVDDAVGAEGGDRRAILRVERDEPIAGRHV